MSQLFIILGLIGIVGVFYYSWPKATTEFRITLVLSVLLSALYYYAKFYAYK